MQTMTNADSHAAEKAKKLGVYSTWGQGMTGPKGWKDSKCLHPSLSGVMMVCTLMLFLHLQFVHCC